VADLVLARLAHVEQREIGALVTELLELLDADVPGALCGH
jgi:hypothetical protein